ncbi:MAG: sodium-translocating pyrophosphatase [Clostridia bacterium]|jgi:K(+)-stimulated pyrophosphate-energized sodium pump|nr:sodium-translocating pyrophosphatase [Clostridia bacterium]MBT7121746.1 sodium-translocating pyrophosphatase [Clostridia bacterium]
MVIIVFIAVGAALLAALYNYMRVKRSDAGTDVMKDIAGQIQMGARTFLIHEFKIIGIVAAVVAVVLGVVVAWYVAVAFLLGALLSASAGFVGMKIATIANVRVSNTARVTKSLGKTLKIAFQGGSVMGLCVGAFAITGLIVIFLVFGVGMGQVKPEALTVTPNWLSINFIPFTMTVLGYALGCSLIAMFNRVGGGIYTKAADMGADLVGKTEAHIPEDDPRNPATIADNVGDNVGDVAGLGSDLLESFVGAIVACIALASYTFYLKGADVISGNMVTSLIEFPIIFVAIGLIACVVGIMFLIFKKISNKPHKELNISTWVSAGLTVVATGVFTYFFFSGYSPDALAAAGFKAGALSPWIAAVLGIGSGIAIGMIAEYYTSYDFAPTRKIAKSSIEGAALTITDGLGVGMKSTLFPVAILAVSTIVASQVAGIYGVTMAAIGMLSFVAATVSVDTYGPIADNAGGISEMAKLDPKVRKITDKLDSVGNTTAAVGKGFAIGSAALAALSLLASYLHSQVSNIAEHSEMILNVIDPLTLAGVLIGGALPFFFSGLLIDAVSKAARNMVREVRRQFSQMPGILTGKQKPDTKRCIEIASSGALKEMKIPAFIAILSPLVGGFIFGANFVGGMLIGTTLTGIMLALFTANAGGAWDNAKKYVESDKIEGHSKGSDAHAATVIGDTVGDPLKDTVGPSLDILIKIMATVSLIAVSIFGQFNLFSLF